MGVYEVTTWLARIAVNANRFLKENETSSYIELTSEPESITQNGTEFTAARMNNIEGGIFKGIGQNDADSSGGVTAHTIGDEFIISCLYSGTVSVPDGLSVGVRKRIRNVASSGVITLGFSGTDTFLSGNTSIIIPPDGWIEIEKQESGKWVIPVCGGIYRTISTTTTVTPSDAPEETIYLDGSSGSITVTLSDGSFDGQKVTIHCFNSSTAQCFVKGTGVYDGASSTGTYFSPGYSLTYTWSDTESRWIYDDVITADFIGGNQHVIIYSKGNKIIDDEQTGFTAGGTVIFTLLVQTDSATNPVLYSLVPGSGVTTIASWQDSTTTMKLISSTTQPSNTVRIILIGA